MARIRPVSAPRTKPERTAELARVADDRGVHALDQAVAWGT